MLDRNLALKEDVELREQNLGYCILKIQDKGIPVGQANIMIYPYGDDGAKSKFPFISQF